MNTLDVGQYNHQDDTITIEGTVYAGALFRDGFGINAMIGQVLRIDKHENGVVTVTRLVEFETLLANERDRQTKRCAALCEHLSLDGLAGHEYAEAILELVTAKG